MQIFKEIKELRDFLDCRPTNVGFVPTMGALHAGHIALVEKCRSECKTVVVSIFVNPTQFNDPKDLEKYPRQEAVDFKLLESVGVDAIFVPSVQEIYPEPDTRLFNFGAIETVMEGASRPGHFNGVAQVVSRLFEIVKPEKAYFGEKDFQQLAIIRAMVEQLGLDVKIVPCPIVRAEDGLALSSRNALLSSHERAAAPEIYKTLCRIAAMTSDHTIQELEQQARHEIDQNPHLETEYLCLANPVTLQPSKTGDSEKHIFTAVRCGKVRLIDNIRCK